MTVIDYDPEGDSLFIRVKNDTYSHSKREGQLITDFNCNNEVIGFEVLHASKFFDDADLGGWNKHKLFVENSKSGLAASLNVRPAGVAAGMRPVEMFK